MTPADVQGRGRTLWLHVGTHKTGTTSLQEGLQRKKDDLARDGLRVWPEKNAWRLANLFLRPSLRTSPRVSGAAIVPALADLQALPDRMKRTLGPLRDMIISSEEFCMMRDSLEAFALTRVMCPLFDRIVPIVVLRRTADWKAARQDQLRKTGMWDTQKSLPDRESADGDWYYDPAAILAFWGTIGPVQMLDYDLVRARDGSILPAIAGIIGQPGLFADTDLWLNARSERPMT